MCSGFSADAETWAVHVKYQLTRLRRDEVVMKPDLALRKLFTATEEGSLLMSGILVGFFLTIDIYLLELSLQSPESASQHTTA